MRRAIIVGLATAISMATSTGWAGGKPPPAKQAPVCSALAFRALPAGSGEGEQTAGLYKSRLARFELRATVQNGAPANYYLVANGSRLGAAKGSLPTAADSCAVAKKMPKPDIVVASCNGERFSLVIAHAGNERYALLYSGEGTTWKYCGAGTF
jgi:hypothetical protein